MFQTTNQILWPEALIWILQGRCFTVRFSQLTLVRDMCHVRHRLAPWSERIRHIRLSRPYANILTSRELRRNLIFVLDSYDLSSSPAVFSDFTLCRISLLCQVPTLDSVDVERQSQSQPKYPANATKCGRNALRYHDWLVKAKRLAAWLTEQTSPVSVRLTCY